jgi:RNA polymerase sigma-70 factor (ECF subfamily)
LRFLGNREAAEDATQEAFIRAQRAIASFRGARFRSWLFSIVANAARDELRRLKRRPQRSLDNEELPPLDPPDRGPSPESEALRSDLRRALEAALLELPDDWRLTVVLSDVHGLTNQEVAEATGVAVGTVKSRLSRARGRLRDILRDSGELDDAPRRQGVGR